jgi:CHAT domain-containing protein/tetratricopeptide (TPR) repeat protein
MISMALVSLIAVALSAPSDEGTKAPPQNPFGLLGQAERVRRSGRFAEARALLVDGAAACERDGDQRCAAVVLVGLGEHDMIATSLGAGAAECRHALERFPAGGDARGRALALSCVAEVEIREARSKESIEDAEAAVTLARLAGDEPIAWRAAARLGQALRRSSRNKEADQVLARLLDSAPDDPAVVADARIERAYAWVLLGRSQDALAMLAQVRAEAQRSGDRFAEAMSRYRLGSELMMTGDVAASRVELEAAIGIWRDLGYRWGEAEVRMLLGNLERRVSEYGPALRDYQAALDSFEEQGHRYAVCAALGGLALVYGDLGETGKALETHRAAADAWERMGQLTGYARVLVEWGDRQLAAGLIDDALSRYERALPILRELEDGWAVGRALGGMGAVYARKGRLDEATRMFEEALSLRRAVRDRIGEAWVLADLGEVLVHSGKRAEGIARLEEAIPLHRSIGDRAGEAKALALLARALAADPAAVRPRAILHAKQSVNRFQALRGDLAGVGDGVKRSYAESVSFAYRLLAELLVDDGRVLEAQAVLELLKRDEVNRLLRRGESAGGAVHLEPTERVAEERYGRLATALEDTERKLEPLRRLKEPSPAVVTEIKSLEAVVAAERASVAGWFAGLAEGLAGVEARRSKDADALESVQADLRRLDAVLVYAIFGSEHVRLLVFTPTGREERRVDLTSAEVSRRVFALREALQSPGKDPRDASAKVWDVLVAPIAGDLAAASPKLILWSLDGPLRYVPTAALWDASRGQWLVEQYRSAAIATASLRTLTKERARTWRALGLGVTEQHGDLSRLAAVDGELRSVVRDDASPQGALPGKRLLDAQFTRDAMLRELKGSWPIVHIASHYIFSVPEGAADTGSYLLLGDGSRFTLRELDQLKTPVFADVDLLTLSACETAVAAESRELSGAEVDGLAIVAQRRGAASVLATLWPVNDPATAAFMVDLYIRLRGGKLSKAEALQQAQLAMIRGQPDSPSPKGIRSDPSRGLSARATTSKPAARGSRSHPYYWAPFVLLGNGN